MTARRMGPVLLAVALLAAGPVAAGPDSVRLRAGAPSEAGDVDGAAVALTFDLEDPSRLLTWPGEDVHLEAAASSWSGASPDGDVYTTHVGPTWHYEPGWLGALGFAEVGTSLAWVSEQRVAGADLGSLWHFTTHAVLGLRLGRTSPWHAAFRVRHSSNAGFGDPNPGLDIAMFELGYTPGR